MIYTLRRRLRTPAPPSSGNLESEYRVREIEYLRLQTIFAGFGVAISGLLSAAGIWIGIQLAQASDRDRIRELEMNRTALAEGNFRAVERACLEFTLRLRENTRNPLTDAEGQAIRNQVETICSAASIDLRNQRAHNEELARVIGQFLTYLLTSRVENSQNTMER